MTTKTTTKATRVSKTTKLIRALEKGQRMTPAQARSRLGIQNLRAEVYRARKLGYNIELTHSTTRGQVPVPVYVLA